MYGDGLFWGMHLLWWVFWVVLIIVFFSLLTPVPRHKLRETPIEILKRRYAAGEISSQEYEERKSRLERDSAAEVKK